MKTISVNGQGSFLLAFRRVTALGTAVTLLAAPELAFARGREATPAAAFGSAEVNPTSTSLPRSLPYEEGPVPAGYVVQHRLWHPMWIGGAGLTLGSWLLPAGLAAGYDNYNYFVPVVGPLLDPWSNESDVAALRITLSVLHATGIGMIVAGLLIDNPRFVRADLAGLRLTPVVTGREVGAQVSGRF